VTAGSIFGSIYSYTVGTGLGSALASVQFGPTGNPTNGRYSTTFTLATAGNVVFLVDTNNATITSGNVVNIFHPQLEPGSVMTAYQQQFDSAGFSLLQGSVPPTIPTAGFTYTSTTTTIDWSWVAFSIYRTDAQTISIPLGTQNYSGLSASTNYYFYPYWNLPNVDLGWDGPFTAKTAAEMAIIQIAYSIPLCTTGVLASTTSSGGGSGGGGGLSCLHESTLVHTTRGELGLSDVVAGDVLCGPRGTCALVEAISLVENSQWIMVTLDDDRTFICTPSHVLRSPSGDVIHARDLTIRTVLDGDGRNLAVSCLQALDAPAHCVQLKIAGSWFCTQPGSVIHHNGNIKP